MGVVVVDSPHGVDHNVVKQGIIHDPYRIDATLGTLYHINAKGGKIILMSS